MWLGVMALIVVMINVSMLIMRRLVVAFLAMEHQEIHAERIERCNENTRKHREICITLTEDFALVDRLNDGVFRVEAREQWESNQRQRSDQ